MTLVLRGLEQPAVRGCEVLYIYIYFVSVDHSQMSMLFLFSEFELWEVKVMNQFMYQIYADNYISFDCIAP